MNRVLQVTAGIVVAIAIVIGLGASVTAQAVPRFWTAKLSTPSTQSSKTFNLDYQVVSTVADDSFTVRLYQNGVDTGLVQNVSSTGKGGDSGRFTVTVTTSGSYSYVVSVKNLADGTTKQSASVTTMVTADAPAAPVVQQAVRSGDTYTVTFLVPAGSPVTTVTLYAAPGTTVSTQAGFRVLVIAATPGTPQMVTFTATDPREYSIAIVASDANGNQSAAGSNRSLRLAALAAAAGTTSVAANNDDASAQTTIPVDKDDTITDVASAAATTADTSGGWRNFWTIMGALAVIGVLIAIITIAGRRADASDK